MGGHQSALNRLRNGIFLSLLIKGHRYLIHVIDQTIIFIFKAVLYHQVCVIMFPFFIYHKYGAFLYKTCGMRSCPISLWVPIRGVNRSPKILDLRKCPNPIRTSVGHPIFSWTIFGQAISYNKFLAFFDLWAFGAQFSERYCIVHFSLYISDSQRTSGM